MSNEQVSAALAGVAPEAREQLAAMLESEPVGRLFDGRILKWIIARLGPLLQGLTAEEIAVFLVGIGIPMPWAAMLAQLAYQILHPVVPPIPPIPA